MKKRLLEATVISLMLMIFVVPSVLAYDVGPYYDHDPDWGGEFGEYVAAGVAGNVGDYAQFEYGHWYASRVLGDCQGFNGYLWFRFYYTVSDYIEWYDTGTSYNNGGTVNTNYLRTRAWSGFYDSQSNEWTWTADISIQIQ